MTTDTETTVKQLCDRYNVEATWEALGFNVRDDDGWEHNAYTVTLFMDGRRITTPWKQGIGIKDAPDASGVLSGLITDASCSEDGFDEFCANMGYDEDSRKAFATFEACQRTGRKLRRFLADHYDEFMQADSD